jgi:hypothetical protein
LQELTLEVFAEGLRECETILAPILFEKEAIDLYCTSVGQLLFFLFLFFGGPLWLYDTSADDLTNIV